MDVDGVLTDGGIIIGSGGVELKSFHVRDGMAINIARRIFSAVYNTIIPLSIVFKNPFTIDTVSGYINNIISNYIV